MDNLINRIPGSRLLISNVPDSALRTHVESLGKQAFSKPCLVNLISKDTHLVFCIYISTSLAMSPSVLNALPDKLDIKRHSPSILYILASIAMSTLAW